MFICCFILSNSIGWSYPNRCFSYHIWLSKQITKDIHNWSFEEGILLNSNKYYLGFYYNLPYKLPLYWHRCKEALQWYDSNSCSSSSIDLYTLFWSSRILIPRMDWRCGNMWSFLILGKIKSSPYFTRLCWFGKFH